MEGLAARGVHGLDESGPVTFLRHGDVVAVAGPASVDDFHEEHLGSLEWIGSHALRHEQVVEAVMAVSAVVPVRFGTLFRSPATLTEFIARHRQTISRTLTALRGKGEWSIKGYLGLEAAKGKVGLENPAIQSELAHLPASPGARYLQQKRLDKLIEAHLGTWSKHLTEGVCVMLDDAALGSVELRLLPPASPAAGERMIFHRGFLLSHNKLPAFRAAISEQARIHAGDGLRLELCGPWPPHNFCPALADADWSASLSNAPDE